MVSALMPPRQRPPWPPHPRWLLHLLLCLCVYVSIYVYLGVPFVHEQLRSCVNVHIAVWVVL
jgi:hypothetical protein